MRILITGANGYIGSSLYNAFKNKYEVTQHTRKLFDLTSVNDTLAFFKDRYFDVVIHCATVGGNRLKEDNWDIIDDNLTMYYNLLSCRSSYGKLINLGSGAETHDPESPYGLSKRVISNSVLQKENFFNVIIYAVFDENELDTRFIKSNIKRYINKEPILVYENKRMTFFYMKDLILLIEYIATTSSSKLMMQNCCGYVNNYTLLEIANMINQLSDYKVPVLVGTEPAKDYVCDYNAGYGIPYFGFKTGILETYKKLLS